MNDRMPVGIDDFQKVREGYYFVDKTDFIKDLIDSHGEVTLLIRPRRFGKTLTMSMLDWFFSAERKGKPGALPRIAYCFRWCWIYEASRPVSCHFFDAERRTE